MIEFPAIWIWYGFLFLGGLLLLLFVAQLLNGFRYGSRMPLNILVSGIFLVGVIAIGLYTSSLLGDVDWTGTYTLSLPSASFFRLGF